MLQHQASVSVVLDGRDLGAFRGWEGGEKTSDAQLVRPGGMAPPIAMPGPYSYGEVTLRRFLRHGTDSGLIQWCKDRVGYRVSGARQPLDERGRAGFHSPEGVAGVLQGVTSTDTDPDGTDAVVLELTVLPDTQT